MRKTSSEENVGKYFLNNEIILSSPDGKPLDIPVGGAIGLLALGDVGTIAWRQKILAVKTELAQRTQANLNESKQMDFSSINSGQNE